MEMEAPTAATALAGPAGTALGEQSAGELARRIAAGDGSAEAELVRRYGDGVAFLLRRTCRDRETADDLYQETFRLALEKMRRGELREVDRLAGFLRGLAKNLAIDHYRGRARRAQREAPLEGDELVPLAATTDHASQLSLLLAGEKAALVRRLIGELASPRDREVLFRFYLGEEERDSLCADLGLTSPELNMILFRARRRYRELFENAVGAGGRGK
jgi:RNA polymerase sigma-70 factor (ECF subfamily)